jgi:hypothetical protein
LTALEVREQLARIAQLSAAADLKRSNSSWAIASFGSAP